MSNLLSFVELILSGHKKMQKAPWKYKCNMSAWLKFWSCWLWGKYLCSIGNGKGHVKNYNNFAWFPVLCRKQMQKSCYRWICLSRGLWLSLWTKLHCWGPFLWDVNKVFDWCQPKFVGTWMVCNTQTSFWGLGGWHWWWRHFRVSTWSSHEGIQLSSFLWLSCKVLTLLFSIGCVFQQWCSAKQCSWWVVKGQKGHLQPKRWCACLTLAVSILGTGHA